MNTIRHLMEDRPHVLAEGRVEQIAAPAGGRRAWRLQVDAGAVWLTWPDGGADWFLAAGESVEIPAGRVALVEVEPRLQRGAALLRIVPAAPDRPGPASRSSVAPGRQAGGSPSPSLSPQSRVASRRSSSHCA